jgi:hypothetical protein
LLVSFVFFAFFAFAFFVFAGLLEVSWDDDALESCANTGAASEIASAAAKSSENSFFIGVATSLGLYYARDKARHMPVEDGFSG